MRLALAIRRSLAYTDDAGRRQPMNAMSPVEPLEAAPLDMLIVGAGISGIGMAAKLATHCPAKREH
jgi:NADH dehydrogenase FAD-containing subunit